MSNQSQNTQNLPTTPDWSKAPDWAKWFAINKNGMGFWFAKKPWKSLSYWNSYGKEQNAGDDFDPSDWEKSLLPYPDPATYYADLKTMLDNDLGKPKIETLTVQLNTDISGYLAGKDSFITGLVDLLLARMAKEERFSGGDCIESADIRPFDIIVYLNDVGYTVYSMAVTADHDGVDVTHEIWMTSQGWRYVGNNFYYHVQKDIRTITELEAVEFRTAMEAVYG